MAAASRPRRTDTRHAPPRAAPRGRAAFRKGLKPHRDGGRGASGLTVVVVVVVWVVARGPGLRRFRSAMTCAMCPAMPSVSSAGVARPRGVDCLLCGGAGAATDKRTYAEFIAAASRTPVSRLAPAGLAAAVSRHQVLPWHHGVGRSATPRHRPDLLLCALKLKARVFCSLRPTLTVP